MSWSANIRGRFAAFHHNTGPIEKDIFSMASVTKIAPSAQSDMATIHWLNSCLDRAASETFTEWATIPPGVAAAFLERNEGNRNISPTKAEHYALDMAAGRWTENGETIIVSADGSLNDGQHRLQAVIDSNTPIRFLFVFGVSRDSRATVDQGKARSAGDFLAMQGVHYASNAATAAKFIMAYERSGGKNISLRSKLTNAEIVARVKADDEIVKSTVFAFHHYQEYRALFSVTVMASCHYVLAEIHPKDAAEYLAQVALGESIKRGDPAFAVRAAFLAEKRERQDAMEIIFHGWNAYRQGRPLKIAKRYGALPALV